DHFLFEVIDPETLEPAPAGAAGELVITTLAKEALPVIRYPTRGLTRLNHEPSAPRRPHVRIMPVPGRSAAQPPVRGLDVYPPQLEAVLVGFPGLAPHYQIVLTRTGALDDVTLEVELASDAPAGEAERNAKADAVCRHIKSLVGVTCDVAIKAPGEVPRSQ